MVLKKKKELGIWVPGQAYFKFLQRVRAADLKDVRRMEKIFGVHHNNSMAKAKGCDPVFGADQDLGQVFEAVQAHAM